MSEPGRDRSLTCADHAAFPDDGHRHQLLDGELIVMPSVSTRHQEVSLEIMCSVMPCARQHDLGELFYAPLDVTLDDHNVVQPDIFFISKARAGILAGCEEPCRPAAFPGIEFTLSVVSLPNGR